MTTKYISIGSTHIIIQINISWKALPNDNIISIYIIYQCTYHHTYTIFAGKLSTVTTDIHKYTQQQTFKHALESAR